MITDIFQQQILHELKQATGTAVTSIQLSPVGGGSINDTYRLRTNNGQLFFCKINSLAKFPSLFSTEKSGLEYLAAQQVIRIPRVISLLETASHQVLLLEWIEQGLKTTEFWNAFGEQLATLHHKTFEQFGLSFDNYMGALPQRNRLTGNWCDFFIRERLQPQVEMAVNGHLLDNKQARQFEKVYARLPGMFPTEPACLLHGDLWSGNYLCDEQGKPVLIDPAVYYGHRSMDLAMTTLFGGFDALFYESYQSNYPFPPGFREQWQVCNLYPLLIHLNLFGQSYLRDILNTIERY
jgi:protein-ribulosamine 3-kinase